MKLYKAQQKAQTNRLETGNTNSCYATVNSLSLVFGLELEITPSLEVI
jgi:hypothetical protein